MEEAPYNLSEDLMEDIRGAFAKCDPENTGLIEVEDLGEVMRALSYNYTEAELYNIAEELDEEYIGKIDFDSFLHFLTKKYKVYEKRENLITAFKIFDRDGHNSITQSKLRAIFTTLGEKISDEDFELVFSEVDGDGDGIINLKDFISAYRS